MSRLVGLVLAVLLSLAAATGTARAHAQLVASEPADGAVVAAAPAEIRLVFNEPVAVTRLSLVAPGGAPVELDGRAAGETVTAALPGAAARGSYLLSWRVVSADGHPIGGTLAFAIGAPSAAGVAGAIAPNALQAAIVAVRALLIAAAAIGVGGALFVAVLAPGRRLGGRPQKVLVGAAALVAPLAVLALALQGADARGTGLAGIAGTAALAAGAATSFGRSALFLAGAGFAALAALLLRRTAIARLAAGLALLLAAAAFGASGHAATAPPRPAMAFVVALHAGLALAWIGALLPLAALLGPGRPDPLGPIRRFSAAAITGVAILVATGLALAWVQVETPDALLATAYGRLLLGKLALVAALLALALWNRAVLTPALARGAASARTRLRRSIAIELAVALALLAVVAGWRLTPPPRAIHAADRAGIALHLHGDGPMANLVLRPGRRGDNTAELALYGADIAPLAARAVIVSFRAQAADLEPIERRAVRTGEGRWRVDSVPLPLAGRWSVRIDILVTDFDQTTLDGRLTVRP